MCRIARALALLAAIGVAVPTAAADRDTVAVARELYNAGQYGRAIEAATRARQRQDQADAASLVIARARLERFRERADQADLDEGRLALQSVDLDALSLRDRREYLVGLAELQYFDGHFGPAAELFDSVLGLPQDSNPGASMLGEDRLLDWWATALDRRARESAEPRDVYARMLSRMEAELRAWPDSATAAYWIPVAARGVGDLPRAWDTALAGWARAPLTGDRADRLRADLDRFVRDLLIPELESSASTRASLTNAWSAATGAP